MKERERERERMKEREREREREREKERERKNEVIMHYRTIVHNNFTLLTLSFFRWSYESIDLKLIGQIRGLAWPQPIAMFVKALAFVTG